RPRKLENVKEYMAKPAGSFPTDAITTAATGCCPNRAERMSSSVAKTSSEMSPYSASLRIKDKIRGTSASAAGRIVTAKLSELGRWVAACSVALLAMVVDDAPTPLAERVIEANPAIEFKPVQPAPTVCRGHGGAFESLWYTPRRWPQNPRKSCFW